MNYAVSSAEIGAAEVQEHRENEVEQDEANLLIDLKFTNNYNAKTKTVSVST